MGDYVSKPVLTQTQFKQKYINKSFTYKDLTNPLIFDENEVEQYLRTGGGFKSFPSTRIDVWKLGKSIVKDHPDMALRLPQRMETYWSAEGFGSTGYSHLELIDHTTRKHYKIGIEAGEDIGHNKWYLEINQKKYTFCDRTQINLYFDTNKCKY